MQFVYHQNSGEELLKIDGDLHKHLFKIRRHNKSKNLFFRNMIDDILYEYEIVDINKKYATLKLINNNDMPIKPQKYLHIGWCIVDAKNIEKMLPTLNEIGVSKITFIRCKYSQNNIKINYQKLEKIAINSSMQCGRSDKMVLDEVASLREFLDNNADCFMFNFSSNDIANRADDIKTIVVGCEGGFGDDEVAMMQDDKIVGVSSKLVLKSESAVGVVASKLVL